MWRQLCFFALFFSCASAWHVCKEATLFKATKTVCVAVGLSAEQKSLEVSIAVDKQTPLVTRLRLDALASENDVDVCYSLLAFTTDVCARLKKPRVHFFPRLRVDGCVQLRIRGLGFVLVDEELGCLY